jgi:cytochrome b involved in lipid metabolism
MMKKYVTFTLFVFWAIVTAILIAGLAFYQNNKNTGNNPGTSLPAVNSGSPITLTLTEIASHGSQSSCWIIVNNNVYDVTSSLGNHPSGASAVLPYCGKEATNAFKTKNTGSDHLSSSYTWLEQLKLGSVGQTVNQVTTQNVQSAPTNSDLDYEIED